MDKRKNVARLLWLTMMAGTLCLISAYLAGDAYQHDRLGAAAVTGCAMLINGALMVMSFRQLLRWVKKMD